MNYTSYYSNIRNLKNIVPIAISVGVPKYLPTILRYAPLAPTWKIVNLPDGEIYTAAYKSEILAHLGPQKVLRDLAALAGGRPFALMCCKKPLGDSIFASYIRKPVVSFWHKQSKFSFIFYKTNKKNCNKKWNLSETFSIIQSLRSVKNPL